MGISKDMGSQPDGP